MGVIDILGIINLIISALFLIGYGYQFYYGYVALKNERPEHKEEKPHSFAILTCARNEEAVIGHLIGSLKAQDYTMGKIDIFAIADNCTDATAEVAREAGAIVYERFNKQQIGKGYALNYLLRAIERDYGKDAYDAFIVFDADNLVEPNFVSEINKTFSDGYEIVTGYRNSKNYGDSWVSAASGMWFLKEARILNQARMTLGASSILAGTGFLFSNLVRKDMGGGWPFYLLTEDVEFMLDNALRGYKVGYSADAMFYDEQPKTFRQSWTQRLRWAKGGFQVYRKYSKELLTGLFKKETRLFCYDYIMNFAPAFILSMAAGFANAIGLLLSPFMDSFLRVVMMLVAMGIGACACLGIFGVVTTIVEWDKIHAKPAKKILYMFTFPLYIITYIPVAVAAAFVKVKWKPIAHSGEVTMDNLRAQSESGDAADAVNTENTSGDTTEDKKER